MTRLVALVALLLVASPNARADIIVSNAGFETPSLGTGSFGDYQYNPSIGAQGGAGWTFVGSSGIGAVGSGFNMLNPPSGTQAAFIQDFPDVHVAASMTQTISGFDAGRYNLTFYAERRIETPNNPLRVTIDGLPITFGGNSTVAPVFGNVFTPYVSDPILLGAGSHTLVFTSLSVGGADHTTFIDQVAFVPFGSASPLPEPASLAVLGVSVLGLFGVARRQRGPRPLTN